MPTVENAHRSSIVAMLTFALACAPILAQSTDLDPTYQPMDGASQSHFHGGGGQNLAASTGCDHFNRADSDDLGPAWVEEAGDMEIRSELLHGKAINSLSVMEGVNADYRTSEVSAYFQTNGQRLYYVALVAGFRDLNNCVHVKLQDADYDTLVDRVYFRYGNNQAPWNAKNYYFDLATPTAFGTMKLSFRNNGDVARLEVDNPFSGEIEVFECSGLSSKAMQLGTGFGVSTYGDCFLDNFSVNGGECAEGFSLTVSGNSGGTMSFEIEGASPLEQVALVFGTGSGTFTIPFPFACEGTQIGMTKPIDYLSLRSDAAGNAAFARAIPPAAAGVIRVQAIDRLTCEVSEVVTL
jgi:hypothetical protein